MELTKEYFDEQINKLTQQIGGVDGRVSRMATELVNVKEDTVVIREQMPSKELIDKLYNVSDKLVKEVIGYRQEQTASGARHTRVEEWIKEAAPKVGVEFKQ